MDQVELMEHVLDNLKAGRPAGHGLLKDGAHASTAVSAGNIAFSHPEIYSVAPRTRIINGVEVPEPMDKEPESGTQYFVESISSDGFARSFLWTGTSYDIMRFERGQCYESEEAATANCKARYGIK